MHQFGVVVADEGNAQYKIKLLEDKANEAETQLIVVVGVVETNHQRSNQVGEFEVLVIVFLHDDLALPLLPSFRDALAELLRNLLEVVMQELNQDERHLLDLLFDLLFVHGIVLRQWCWKARNHIDILQPQNLLESLKLILVVGRDRDHFTQKLGVRFTFDALSEDPEYGRQDTLQPAQFERV